MRYAISPISRGWTDFDRAFKDLTQDFFTPEVTKKEAEFLPRVEVYENEAYYAFSFDVPGFQREDLKIDIDGDRLIVSGVRKKEFQEESTQSFYTEKTYGTFTRTLKLPEDVSHEEVEAELKSGVLNLKVKKLAQKAKRTVEIKEIAS